MKTILLLLILSVSNYCSAQSFRISENPTTEDVDISIMPGINPEGERLMQFTFISYNKRIKDVYISKLFLEMEDGSEVVLVEPLRDTSYLSARNARMWFASYVLDNSSIAALKKSRIAFVRLEVNKKQRKFQVSKIASDDMRNLIAGHF